MTQAETDIVKALLREVADKDLPAIIQAEEQKLPASYAPLVQAVTAAVMPELIKAIDAKIDSIKAS